MKKGFTLIELLAVIIILAVIALIATPTILNVVDSAKESARKSSIAGYADATKLAVNEYQFEHSGLLPDDINGLDVITNTNNVTCGCKNFNNNVGVILSNCTVGDNSTQYYYLSGRVYDNDTEFNQQLDDRNLYLSSSCLVTKANNLSSSDVTYTGGTGGDAILGFDNSTYNSTTNELTIYTVNYVESASVTGLNYSIVLNNLPVDISQISSIDVISSSVMSTIEDFQKYVAIKLAGGVEQVVPTYSNWANATDEEMLAHSATSNELTIDNVSVTCNSNNCIANISESLNNLTNIPFHETTTNGGDTLEAIYIPIKFTIKINTSSLACSILQTTDTTPGILSGTGTSANPYLVESIEDLVALSNNVNGGNTYNTKYISIKSSLDFNDTKSYVDANTTIYGDINGNGTVEGLKIELTTDKGFNPIGNNTTKFSGTILGNTNCIDNLFVNRSDTSYIGLVGYIDHGGITALNLNDINITGYDYTAALAGYNSYGNVTENKVTGNILGNNYVSLISGYNYSGNLKSNIVEGNITGVSYLGGIVGYAFSGTASGINKGGSITSTGSNYGRIAGYKFTSSTVSGLAMNNVIVNGSTITNNYNADKDGSDISSMDDVTSNINLAELVLDTYIGGDDDSNGYYWDYNDSGTLIFKNTTDNPLIFSLSGSGTSADPYLINSYEDLKQASLKLSSYYKLNSDIDLTGIEIYEIGSYLNPFTGTLNGNTKTISNLTLNIQNGSYIGLTGYNKGTITALNITNLNITGSNYIGGLTGYNNGNITETTVSGNIVGNNYISLIAGYNYSGTMTSNIVEGNVTGNNYLGGIVGYIFGGTISGINKGGSITSIGTNVGRIYGYSISGTLNSSALNSITINGSTVISTSASNKNGLDITLSDLSNQTTYTDLGFNFTDETQDYIWYLDDSVAKLREGSL